MPELYIDEPKSEDIRQGLSGTCYLLAGLGMESPLPASAQQAADFMIHHAVASFHSLFVLTVTPRHL